MIPSISAFTSSRSAVYSPGRMANRSVSSPPSKAASTRSPSRRRVTAAALRPRSLCSARAAKHFSQNSASRPTPCPPFLATRPASPSPATVRVQPSRALVLAASSFSCRPAMASSSSSLKAGASHSSPTAVAKAAPISPASLFLPPGQRNTRYLPLALKLPTASGARAVPVSISRPFCTT